MRMNAYLNFNGNCREAFEFYAKTFRGKIEGFMTFGETEAAAHVPPAYHRNIMHVALNLGDSILMGSDGRPGERVNPQGFAVAVHPTETGEAERIFAALSEGGQVEMPLQETFWAYRFGSCTDRFGTPWMVNVQKPMN